MSKHTIYTCDVCNKTQEKPFALHMIANYGDKSDYADVCSKDCAVKFAQDAAEKLGI
jgi:hypothetical protein